MPRPPEGYHNKAGLQVPGVHDIIKAYYPKPALVGWAYNRGKAGVPLYEDAIEIGTVVHHMAELDLRGQSPERIEATLQTLRDPTSIDKARKAYKTFCEWRDLLHVKPIAHEVVLVSETHQLGGCPDCIAWIDGHVALLDFKTCGTRPKTPYSEQLAAMAAHAVLWNEAHPEQPVTQCHIIYLPKDGSRFGHHRYADLTRDWREFRRLITAFAAKTGTPQPADPAHAKLQTEIIKLKAEVAALKAKQTVQLPLPLADGIPAFLKRTKPNTKPRVRVRTDGSFIFVNKGGIA